MLGHVHVPCKSHNHMGTLCGIEHNTSPLRDPPETSRGHKRASRDHLLPDAPDTLWGCVRTSTSRCFTTKYGLCGKGNLRPFKKGGADAMQCSSRTVRGKKNQEIREQIYKNWQFRRQTKYEQCNGLSWLYAVTQINGKNMQFLLAQGKIWCYYYVERCRGRVMPAWGKGFFPASLPHNPYYVVRQSALFFLSFLDAVFPTPSDRSV